MEECYLSNTPPWVIFTFLKLYKRHYIVQSIQFTDTCLLFGYLTQIFPMSHLKKVFWYFQGDHPFSTYAEFSEKLTFLTHWYAQ